MTRTNLDSVNNYVDAIGESYWKITLGTNDVSDATRSLSFSDAISQPGDFILELIVDPGQINGGDELKVQNKEGKDAFYGVAQRPNRSSQGNDEIDGAGAAALLQDIPINGEFLGTTTDALIQNIFSQLSTNKIVYNSTASNELSDGTGNVDIRADDEGALNLLNRVVLSHGGEWYVSYNSSNDQYEFIVQNEVRNSTSKTFTEENTREIRDAQVVDEEYDAVVVNGYGDGEDQIVGEYPLRSNWPNDPKLLKYTDKTILSETEANNVAENLYNEHTNWRNIMVYPASDNELLQLGDEVTVNEPRTGLNGDYRVVQRTLNIDLETGSDIEYVLSDRPIGLLDKNADVEEQTKSQTDYSQGNRNTLNENNDDIATSGRGLELEFNIPNNITQDIKGDNSVAKVLLDYKVKDYKKVLPAGDNPTALVDDQTVGVVSKVNNYGNVQRTQTNGNKLNTAPTGEETFGDFLSADTDKELTAENSDIYSVTVPQYIQETGVEGIATDSNGIGIRDINFSADFSSYDDIFDIMVNYSINAPSYFGTTLNDWMYGANANGMGVKVADGPTNDNLDIHYDAKIRYYATSKTLDAKIPVSLIDTDPNGSGDRGGLEGIVYTVFYVNGFESDVDIEFNITFSGFSDNTGGLNINSNSASSYTNYVKSGVINSGDTFTVSFDLLFSGVNNLISSSPSVGTDTSYGVLLQTISSQQHEAEENASGVDNVVAFLEDENGNQISGGADGSTKGADVPNTDTVNVNELDKNEPILIEQTTNATSAEVFVNGTSVGSYSTEEEEIDITSDVAKPGKNTVEIVPDDTGEVHANVITDHKVEGDRQ